MNEQLKNAERWWYCLSAWEKIKIYEREDNREAVEQLCPGGVPK